MASKKREAGLASASPLERDVLEVVLRELRKAVRRKTQCLVTIDPWLQGGGTYVFCSFNETGRSYTIEAASR